MSLNGNTTTAAADDKKHLRPQPDRVEKCPRCDSGNTKFCYFNNYSLSQPRYFCKACWRYWTKGGTLRNVPVGGGCRKNRKSAKLAFDNHNDHLLVENHHQMETNNNNTNNKNVMLCSAAYGPKSNESSPSLADNSNFSSTLRYEDSGTCDGLSIAFPTLQRQSNVHHLGFELGSQNFILRHQPITTSTNDLGFFNNFFEPETTKSLNSTSLYNYGAQPLPLSNEDLSLSNMSSKGFNEINGDVNGNMILLGLPWQVDSSSNNVVGQGSLEKSNSTNVVFGFRTGSNNYNYNYYNNDGCYEVEGGGRSDRWNNNNINAGLVASAGSSWPNLININSTALIM